MSITDRQNRLLVAEDWRRIYQTYRNADFQSYDFENLRRTMIQYIRENYPEDFNDYIESSEYLALIDLIAFLGQSLAYRIDLNSRDNFLELSERKESVLRLARLLSYNAKRNIAGSGFLKMVSVQTSQNVLDSAGRNLSGQVISWNDASNSNWYDQFIKVINAALPITRQFGTPDDKGFVYGVATEQYRFQSNNIDVPIYNFEKNIDGRMMPFEIVSSTFKNRNEIYEEAPIQGNRLAFLYRNDSKGNGSANTGFFMFFKQGQLNQGTFTFTQSVPNTTLDIDSNNINNDDIWLYKLNQVGQEFELWEKISALEGNNVIYNSLEKSIKNFYSAITRVNDRVTLQFSDGVFGNIPVGSFKVYYRVSEGISYTINPRDMRNISIELPYISNFGQPESLIISLSLTSSVNNSSPTESIESIKQRAPSNFYTQNRMITAEDYNLMPFNVNQQIMKVKSVNRSSSGISRYFDLVDPTGKYSKTNLFADDGILYREEYVDSFEFRFDTKTDVESIIYNQLYDYMSKTTLRDYYYNKFIKFDISELSIIWKNKSSETNLSTGYLSNINNTFIAVKVGSYTSTILKNVQIGSLLKFEAPEGYFFNTFENNKLVANNVYGTSKFLWTKVISVEGDGTNGGTGISSNGEGVIKLNDIIPENAKLISAIPPFKVTLNQNVITSIIDLIVNHKPFGLRYSQETTSWNIIYEVNLNLVDNFSLGQAGSNINEKTDSSWLISFITDSEYYTVSLRLLRYIFESDKQIRFYYDSSDKIYDTRTNTIEKDKIKILSINVDRTDTINVAGILVPTSRSFTIDHDWEIVEEFKGLDGYIDSKKIQISFADYDDDGIVDNPEIFELIVGNLTSTNKQDDYIILEKYTIEDQQEDYRYVSNLNGTDFGLVHVMDSEDLIDNLNIYPDGQYFYFIDLDLVKKLDKPRSALNVTFDYKCYLGRSDIKFQYIHNADYETRLDPGITNIVDVFVMTKQYDQNFREYLNGLRTIQPLPPSTDSLYNLLSPTLNPIKTISDEIIYHPARYKILFGKSANLDLQAIFKVVKNTEVVVSDNDIKSQVISSINEFFTIDNWDFGDGFYFTELSTYVMNKMATYITNFLIVPKKPNLSFGSLLEIKAEKDQIFISSATIDDVEIISAVTASRIKAEGSIASTSKYLTQQSITSSGS
jgi:hypothetical protein